jgi:uncharacterized membrane protein
MTNPQADPVETHGLLGRLRRPRLFAGTELSVRQLAITHGIISFFYATVILALTVNLVAGML